VVILAFILAFVNEDPKWKEEIKAAEQMLIIN